MKPTEIQKKIIKDCLFLISSWQDTNDINSPTHFVDIEDTFVLSYLDSNIGPRQEIIDCLGELLSLIKSVKE